MKNQGKLFFTSISTLYGNMSNQTETGTHIPLPLPQLVIRGVIGRESGWEGFLKENVFKQLGKKLRHIREGEKVQSKMEYMKVIGEIKRWRREKGKEEYKVKRG